MNFPGFGNQGGNQQPQAPWQSGCNVENRASGFSSWQQEQRITQDHTGKALESANKGRDAIFWIAAIMIIGGLLQGYFTRQENNQLRQDQPIERAR